jgi:hypothetical protein
VRTHKVVTDEQGHEIRICGSNRWQEIHTLFNDESEDITNYVNHYGIQYTLDEFMAIRKDVSHPSWLDEFDGYLSDSFFSGVLIKLSDCGESAKVFTFLS